MPRLPTPSDFPPSLTLSIIPPPASKPPTNILILLHGLGDTHTPFASLGRALSLPETACLSLRGFEPIPAAFMGSESAGFHWGDDVLFDEGKGEIELDAGFEKGVKRLGEVVAAVKEGGFKEREIMFYGFGQGAMVALALVRKEGVEYGGVVSVGGKLPAGVGGGTAKAKTPVLVCGGSRSRQVTRGAVAELKERFADVEYVKWDKYEDAMPASREEMLPLMKFFARRLRSRAGVPDGAVEV